MIATLTLIAGWLAAVYIAELRAEVRTLKGIIRTKESLINDLSAWLYKKG